VDSNVSFEIRFRQELIVDKECLACGGSIYRVFQYIEAILGSSLVAIIAFSSTKSAIRVWF